MKPGDIIRKEDPITNRNRFWLVEGVFIGALGQENLVKLRSLTEKPGVWIEGREAIFTIVPEALVAGHIYSALH